MTIDDAPSGETRDHWENRYSGSAAGELSWFQAHPSTSLELLVESGADRSAAVLDVGGGDSSLVDSMVAAGWSDVTVLDVSQVALDRSRARLGPAAGVRWLQQDLLAWAPPRRLDVWHDRAVFHFLVDEEDRRRYRRVLGQALAPGGAVIVGTFAENGPTHCSGLPVVRYGPEQLAQALGTTLDVLATRHEIHETPSGAEQPFTWLLLRVR